MTSVLSGSCSCGDIRYTSSAEPLAAVYCQCRDCQRVTGTGHSAAVLVPKETFKLTGKPSYFDLKGDSGQTKTCAFCPRCGSPLFALIPPGVALWVGSLDDPSKFNPQAVLYTASGQAWDHIDPSLTRFEKNPPTSLR